MVGIRLAQTRSAIQNFLQAEAAGGIVLIAAAAAALIAANSPLADLYQGFLHARIGRWSVHHIVNDGLMSLFFLTVGLEIKREFLDGHLTRWPDRTLPLIAAAGGMIAPALIYLAIAGGDPALHRGWAIPAATDIAFAIGVLALLGRRVPVSLRIFLTTVAIADDLGAVAIIAIAYTGHLNIAALSIASLIVAAMFILNRRGIRKLWPYLALAALLWLAVLLSGIHATVAGVLAAAAIPIAPSPGREDGPLHRLENALHPWIAFGVVPIFGFANAGVDLAGSGLPVLMSPLPFAIAAALFFGKQIGIFASIRLAVAFKLAPRPAGARWAQIYGIAILCGIGFTMSLFIGGLAFPNPELMAHVKIGVLAGSLLSALAGWLFLFCTSSRPPDLRD